MDQACVNAIASKPPPTNVPCPTICGSTDFINGTHCSTLGVPTNSPIITKDPSFGPNGGYCYCCCSCFAMDTPIGVTLSEYVFVQDLNKGDKVIATGSDLNWKETTVKYRSGGLGKTVIRGLYLVTYKLESESEYRQLLVGPDHLFLMFTQRKLKAVQYLIPGDNICGADGKKATVLFIVSGSHNTSIHTIELAGNFNGKDLSGHLLNSNGVVTADFAVQAYFETSKLHETNHYHFSGDQQPVTVGTKEYGQLFHSKALDSFLNDTKQWPKGFMPYRNNLINVPLHASAYFTPAQSDDIKKSGVFLPKAISVPQTMVLRLMKSIHVYYPDTNFLLDWNNSVPNAYSWQADGQIFVVVNGGLARLEGIYMEFFSLLLLSMQSRLDPESPCVGEADYNAAAYQMRKVWIDPLYPTIISAASSQMDKVFALVSPQNAGGDPGDPCIDPGLACRQQAVASGTSFMGVPGCAKPLGQNFELVKGAFDKDMKSIVLYFNKEVDKASAETAGNYKLEPQAQVTGAALNGSDHTSVVLQVTGIQKLKYKVTASNVMSASGQLINPEMNSVIV